MALHSGDWSFQCTACGKCCNSPPQISLPELFYHQRLFVGALGLRRQPRLREGQRIGSTGMRVKPEDAAAMAELNAQFLHQADPANAAEDFILHTQAIDYPSLGQCPALLGDGRCSIHDDHKPRTCAIVPLDALLPDRLQHAVLAERSHGGREYIGADCILPGAPAGWSALTRGQVLGAAQQELNARRQQLIDDKRYWGDPVFRELSRENGIDAATKDRIPQDQLRVLPLAPILLTIARASDPCRLRCIEYLHAQIALIDQSIAKAITRKHAADRIFTRQLRSFSGSAEILLAALKNQPPPTPSANAAEIERWLGLDAAPSPHGKTSS